MHQAPDMGHVLDDMEKLYVVSPSSCELLGTSKGCSKIARPLTSYRTCNIAICMVMNALHHDTIVNSDEGNVLGVHRMRVSVLASKSTPFIAKHLMPSPSQKQAHLSGISPLPKVKNELAR